MKSLFMKATAILLSIAFIFTFRSYFFAQNVVRAAAYAVWPAEANYKTITTYFNSARNNSDYASGHNGIDIAAAGGSDIYAVVGGQVVSAEWKDDYGYLVILYHPDLGVYTFYAHASKLLVSTGMKVQQGDVIAKVGNTGNSFGNHIHYGICDSILGGYPARYYYDPLTYFVYSDNTGSNNESNNNNTTVPDTQTSCNCSEDYAGVYTTKGVVTYLNIRADHSTNSAVVGSIPHDAEFTVTKANGEWAHVEYNGITGFVYMSYIQLKEKNKQPDNNSDNNEGSTNTGSDMKIEGAVYPSGNIKSGEPFSIKGVITSKLPIKKVECGVYFRNGEQTSQCIEIFISSETYDLSTYFDYNIDFSVLKDGEYTYMVTAIDSSGAAYHLVTSEFTIGNGSKVTGGDVSGDGRINVADLVLLQNYLLKRSDDFSKEQYAMADLNGDGRVDVFDLIELKRAIISVD